MPTTKPRQSGGSGTPSSGSPTDRLLSFILATPFEAISPEALSIVRTMTSTAIGTALAGAAEDGVQELRAFLVQQGGTAASTSLVFGDRLPAASAAQLNAVMARALDFCDAMAPGLHLGSTLVPAALAASELRGSLSGREFLTAVAVGAEVGARLNLGEEEYDGFDPTGVVAPLAATATVGRILGLTHAQLASAMGLAFNRAGGSFQSNVDGSLAVRMIQGWTAESALVCVQLARRGVTGPHGYLDGVYGFTHLFGRGSHDSGSMVDGIGEEFRITHTMFKRYPSCGLTQGITELALSAQAAGERPEELEQIEVVLPPYAHRLVGHLFSPGATPRVAGQFSAQYCAANALLHGASELAHFLPEAVMDPGVGDLARRIVVRADPALNGRGHSAVDLVLTGPRPMQPRTRVYSLDVAPGFPGNELEAADHAARFAGCVRAAPYALSPRQVVDLEHMLKHLPAMTDVTMLIPALVSTSAS